MKRSIIITTAILFLFAGLWPQPSAAQEQKVDNHFDVIQQLSTIKSKSRQLILSAKKKAKSRQVVIGGKVTSEGKLMLDSMRLLYMDLKSSSDGVISRYKSIIDNPKQAKKNGESIKNNLNEVLTHLNQLTDFYIRNNTTSMGLIDIPGLGFLKAITSFGKELYHEIRDWQKQKREEVKAEVDQYVLEDFDDVQ